MLSSLPTLFAARFSSSATASRRAMSNFRLDPTIFNKTLYKRVTDVWLPGVDLSGEEVDSAVIKKWFLPTPEERNEFDGVCRNNFAHALEAIGPDALPTPTEQPFIDELTRLESEGRGDDNKDAAWAALALILLLDQMPRNIFRTNEGLRKVYNHYDVMAYRLSRSLLSPTATIPRLDLHPQWRNSAAHRMWFYMPLLHSEDVEAHNFLDTILKEYANDVEKLDGHKATKDFLKLQVKSEGEHRLIIDKFGRYPHRNEALGRQSTEDEKIFLADGGATFGVEQKKSSG